MTVVISESLRGEYEPGDTLSIPYWEMGSWMSETISEGDDALAKGTVTGSAGTDPEHGSARFSLFIIRSIPPGSVSD